MVINERGPYDVCIIGCGIAGATLSYNLAPKLDVCAVEQKPFKELGSDPCANAVHKDWFDSHDVEPNPSKLDAIGSEIDFLELQLPEESMRADLSWSREGFTLDKEKYVKESLEYSLDRGLDLFQGKGKPDLNGDEVQKVEVDGNRIEADFYVDASGVSAVLRKHFVTIPENALFTGYREILGHEMADKTGHVFQKDRDAAFWVFPLGDRTNIGGVSFRNGAKLRKGVKNLKKELALDKEEVRDSGFGSFPSHKPISLAQGNFVAIGDAGVTVNPLTGGGIGPSVRASNLLAEYLEGDRGCKDFQEKYLEEIGNRFRRNYLLRKVLQKLQPFFWKILPKLAFRKFYKGRAVKGDEKSGWIFS